MSRRRWLVAGISGVVVVVAVIVFFVLRRGRERGFIVGFRALDAGAVIVWRANHDEGRSTSWTTRVDATGREVWTRDIPEVALSVGGTGPVTVVDGAVVVRYGRYGPRSKWDPSSNAAIAFDLETGKLLWDRELAVYVPITLDDGRTSELSTLPSTVSDLAVGKHLIAVSDAGKEDVIKGIVARTGEVAWERAMSEIVFSPAVQGTSFLIHGQSGAQWADAATGKPVARVNPRYKGCFVGDEFVYATYANPPRLVAQAANRPERVIAETFDKSPVETCGRYKDRLVFIVGSWHSPKDPTRLLITNLAGQPLHEIPIGGDALKDTLSLDPSRALWGDGLTRFVPYAEALLDIAKQTSTNSLLMIDLETGAVAWRGKRDDRLIHGELFRAGSHWIWSDGDMSPTIAVFDGATGKLVAAVQAYSYRGVAAMGYDLYRATTPDSLWLFSGDWTTPDKAPIVALELPSLKPRFPPRIIELRDATQAVRAKLGLP